MNKNNMSRMRGATVRNVLALVALAMLMAGCKVPLYSNLNEQEANEILAALSNEGIDAAKLPLEGAIWQIQVEEGGMGRALEILRTQGLPTERYSSLGDVFQKQGLVSTPAEERMRYIHAVSQELSQTLRTIDGVVSARVHVVIPANDPLSEKTKPSSAAVFIKHRADVDLRLLAPAVKDLVAHGIEGLTHDQVSLSLIEARRPASGSEKAEGQGAALVFGALPLQTAVIVLVLLALAAACLAVLPTLLRKRGLDWRSWARRQKLWR